MEIRELDPQTVERIAAGEVVERPASAVKELVENSLDADASRVEVAVEAGGTGSIRVSDDGVGMTESAVRRAVEKHTTSKLGDIEDLESGVGTLGFRGEALHAIGAVSRMTITTRPREGGAEAGGAGADRGTELAVEGGEVTDVSPAGCPAGTTVAVSDLFYNVPARRKYLKQPATEFDHVNTVVTSYALANPDVAVSLSHDGRETFATTGQGDLRETVMSVYGREVATAMLPVEAEATLPEGPLDGLSGLVSHPETNRASREYLSTFVNGRYVTANAVRDAVVEGYGTQLAGDRYPFAVLFVDVDPATVDVNVHPRKLEIRFSEEQAVCEQVRTAVEETLLSEGLLRSSAPRGRSAPEQTAVRPDTGDETPGAGGTEDAKTAAGTADADAGREPTTDSAGTAAEAGGGDGTGAGTETRPEADTDGDRRRARDRSRSRESDGARSSRSIRAAGEQARLGADDPVGASTTEFDHLPSMRVLGQFRDTYVVAETDDGLVLVDQHAADERINYERLKEAFAGSTETQALAEPVELEVTAREAAAFADVADALARLGFRAERTGDRTVEVRTVPALLAEAAGPELVRDLLDDFAAGADAAGTVEAAADEILADLACYPSVTGNTSLTEGSVLDLLDRLDDCTNPYACPHGRPVVVEFDSDEIDDRFERDYPGH